MRAPHLVCAIDAGPCLDGGRDGAHATILKIANGFEQIVIGRVLLMRLWCMSTDVVGITPLWRINRLALLVQGIRVICERERVEQAIENERVHARGVRGCVRGQRSVRPCDPIAPTGSPQLLLTELCLRPLPSFLFRVNSL